MAGIHRDDQVTTAPDRAITGCSLSRDAFAFTRQVLPNVHAHCHVTPVACYPLPDRRMLAPGKAQKGSKPWQVQRQKSMHG